MRGRRIEWVKLCTVLSFWLGSLHCKVKSAAASSLFRRTPAGAEVQQFAPGSHARLAAQLVTLLHL